MKEDFKKGNFCEIFSEVEIGEGSRLGNFVFIRSQTKIGKNCIVGSFVDIEGDVIIGENCSLQSGCYITRGVIIEDEVFFGPRVITMNDKKMSYRRSSLKFERMAPKILRGARIGGGSVLLPGVTIGENVMIGAGSVVTKSIPDNMIAYGNPAKIVGEVPSGERV